MPDTPQGQDERLIKSLEHARQLKAAGKTHDTVEWCKKILGVYPGQEEAGQMLAEAQASLGGQLVEDMIAMGQKHYDIGDYDAAIAEWTRVKSTAPNDPRPARLIADAEAQKSGGEIPAAADSLDLPMSGDTLDIPEPDAPELPDLPPVEETGNFHLPDPDDLLSSAEAEVDAPSDFDSIPEAEENPAAPEAPSGVFGIDESDPFALGDEASPIPSADEASPAAEPEEDMATQPVEPEADVNDMLVTSENMHEAVDDFSAKVDNEPAPISDLDAAAQDMGLEVPVSDEAPVGDVSLDLPEPETPVGDVSLDLPVPEVPAAEENLLEISGSGSSHTPEELARITELMQKGQSYYERGQCQQAVDTWYQILLIDEHYPEAVKAIEKAQGELEMQGKKLAVDLPGGVLESEEEAPGMEGAHEALTALLQSAQQQFEGGNYQEAVSQCEKVVEIDPINREANRIMHEANLKLQAQAAKASPEEALPDPALPAPAAPGDAASLPSIAAPPKPGIPLALLIGGIVGMMVFGAGIFIVYSKFFKPKKEAPPVPKPRVEQTAPVETAPAEPVDTGPSESEVLKFAREKALELFAQSQAAYNEKKYFEAVQMINESIEFNPSDLAAIDFRDQQVRMAYHAYQEESGRYTSAITAFQEGDFGDALRFFYRMTKPQYYSFETQAAISKGQYTLEHPREEIELLIRKSWYNRGLQNLKDQECEKAIEAFKELLILDPNDADAKRHKTMAERYKTQIKDESYFQYVEFLRPRE